MFGSTNPFRQSSSSPFGSPSVFGQPSSQSTNPFTPKLFGSSNTFGSQTGSSIFGTSTGVFGAPSSTSTFGSSSSPAFGSSMPAFGASSTPAFGSSSSSFGGSVFGQKPTFGGFGSTPSQSSPFGSAFQQTQPAFGSTAFGSTTFGAPSQPAFGATSTPAFGSSSTPAFGASATPAFGAASAPLFGATSTPAFGSTSSPAFGSTSSPAFGSTSSPAFGSTSTPLFGNTGPAFGVPSTPAFGSTATSAFGSPSTSLFGSSSTAFGTASAPAFGSSSTSAFGQSSAPSFSFGSTHSFGQSASSFGSTPFGLTQSPFGVQSSSFGAQTTTPAFGSPGFGQTGFGGQQGSRVVPYSVTQEADAGGTQPAGKLESISAMPAYKDKSHEELRWEDYQRGDKGGPSPSGQPTSGITFPVAAQANPFGSTGAFGQTAANPFSSTAAANPFAPKTPTFGSSGYGSSSSPSPFGSTFGSSQSNPFSSATSTPSGFGAPSNTAFGSSTSPSIFGGTTAPAFSSPSPFGSAPGSTSTFSSLNFGNTQSSGLFQSSTPSLGQAPSPFGQPTGFQQTTPAFGSNIFSTPSTGFGGSLFSSSTPILSTSTPAGFGQTTTSISTSFQSAPAQTLSNFSFNNFGQTQPAPSSGFGGSPSMFGQGIFGQSVSTQPNMVMQPAPMTNPFGTLPAMPQMSIGRVGSAPSVQYGISSMPVSEKPVPVRISSLLTPRHLSQRRIRVPARKYHPNIDGQRVAFFSDDETAAATPKADALFIPRENPRSLIIRPIEQWPFRSNTEKQSSKDTTANGNGKVSGEPSAPVLGETSQECGDGSATENGHAKGDNVHPSSSPPPSPSKTAEKINGVTQDNHVDKETDLSYIKMSGHRAGEAAIVYEHGAGIEALMPKLRHSDYYTEPRIQELAAKERAEPGFCRRVKDFVVGRHGFGSIKFFGETDERRLDLESIVQFNHREVIVYKDESKKPAVGQGLNKPAEVTLLNIKCMNKKTGQQYTEGPKVEKYKEMLIKKAEEQGAEFVSYDAVKGEWKFRVKHFSSYEFGDGELGDGDIDVSFL